MAVINNIEEEITVAERSTTEQYISLDGEEDDTVNFPLQKKQNKLVRWLLFENLLCIYKGSGLLENIKLCYMS